MCAGASGTLANVGTQYGTSTGTVFADTAVSTYVGITAGLSSDPSKSGLIASFSGLTLGTIPSEKLGNFYIRY